MASIFRIVGIHQSHVGGVAPALLPTPFIPHARVAALVYIAMTTC